MKQLIFLLLMTGLFACNNPSGEITGSITEWSGSYEVLPGADKPTLVTIDYVYVQPTWGQAFYFNNKSGGIIEISAGIFLFIIGSICVYRVATKQARTKAMHILYITAGAIGIISSLVFTFSGPGTIRWNNNIKIEKAVYEKYKANDNLKDMWNQLYADKRIVGTSGK